MTIPTDRVTPNLFPFETHMMDVVYPHAGPTRNGKRLPRISKNGKKKKKKCLHQVLVGKVNFYTLQVRVSLPGESPRTEDRGQLQSVGSDRVGHD